MLAPPSSLRRRDWRLKKLARMGIEIGIALQELGGAAHIDVLCERMAARRRARRQGVGSRFRAELERALECFERMAQAGRKPVFQRAFGEGSRRWRMVGQTLALEGVIVEELEETGAADARPGARCRAGEDGPSAVAGAESERRSNGAEALT